MEEVQAFYQQLGLVPVSSSPGHRGGLRARAIASTPIMWRRCARCWIRSEAAENLYWGRRAGPGAREASGCQVDHLNLQLSVFGLGREFFESGRHLIANPAFSTPITHLSRYVSNHEDPLAVVHTVSCFAGPQPPPTQGAFAQLAHTFASSLQKPIRFIDCDNIGHPGLIIPSHEHVENPFTGGAGNQITRKRLIRFISFSDLTIFNGQPDFLTTDISLRHPLLGMNTPNEIAPLPGPANLPQDIHAAGIIQEFRNALAAIQKSVSEEFCTKGSALLEQTLPTAASVTTQLAEVKGRENPSSSKTWLESRKAVGK